MELVARHRRRSEESPYERLLGDAIRGDASLFTRDDASRRPGAWSSRFSCCIGARSRYEPGTWGPAAAAAVVTGEDGWHDPKPRANAMLTAVVFLLDIDNSERFSRSSRD